LGRESAGVQFRAGGNAPGQFRFDVHVDIFQIRFPAEFSGGDFPAKSYEVRA